jgi:peptide deformylase
VHALLDARLEVGVALLEIITAPNPILSRRAREVRPDEFGDALAKLTSDMAETMYAAPGVGLAAPQVADGRRILVIDPGDREDTTAQLYKMANPNIVERSKEMLDWPETCLSVPDFEVMVKRNRRVRVEWQDPTTGERIDKWFEGFEAVIVQHELDHLAGRVLLDHVSGYRRNRYIKKRKKAAEKALTEAELDW